MRVLALVPGGIGDQILLFPTFDSLKQVYPNAQIDVVVEPRSVGAYRVSKSVNSTIKFDYRANNSLADWANLLGIVRDREYELVITVDHRWIIGIFLWLTGIPRRIGFAGTAIHSFLTDAVPLHSSPYRPQQYHALLQALGITTPCPELSISIPAKDVEWAEGEQQRLGVKGTGYVLLYDGSALSGSSSGANTYPVDSWQKIIEDFQTRQPALPLVVLRDGDDQEWVQALVQSFPNKLKITSPDDPGKAAAMVAGASLMLCTDSTPLQFAVAAQIFTLGLFGATNPNTTLPSNEKFIALQSTTGKLTDLSPEVVLTKVWGG